MKRLVIFTIAALMLVTPAFAACYATGLNAGMSSAYEGEESAASPAENGYVIDNADLLTDEQEAELEARIAAQREKYKMDIVILTEKGIGSKTPMAYADDYFDYNGYGYGETKDGVLFLLSMAARDWYISTCGRGITAITDYGIGVFEDNMVSYFSDGDYFTGFSVALNLTEKFFAEAESGQPFDVEHRYRGTDAWVRNIAIGVVAGFVIAIIITLSMKSAMNSAKPQNRADAYVRNGSVNMRVQTDNFLYRNITRTKRETSSSGGSSTHSSSSGGSHGGGGGKF